MLSNNYWNSVPACDIVIIVDIAAAGIILTLRSDPHDRK